MGDGRWRPEEFQCQQGNEFVRWLMVVDGTHAIDVDSRLMHRGRQRGIPIFR